ncbi:MAG: hypothetical protein IPN08_12400 [Bacteroidales bacterium]|nr:hypothetical protein [Bacteroidales bacterium]MBK9358177.1 hypothetical protein [Bacteroidales bacterium]
MSAGASLQGDCKGIMRTTFFILTAVPFAGTNGEVPQMNSTSWYILAGIIAFILLCYLLMAHKRTGKF